MLTSRRRIATSVAAAGLALFGFGSLDTALAAKSSGQGPSSNSQAQISGSFSADCTDFTATSDKDLSHVVLYYVDGTSTKVETFADPKSYSVNGSAPMNAAEVKAGTSDVTFPCSPSQDPRAEDPCAYGGAVGLVTGKDEWTLARAGYYVVDGVPVPVNYPKANGPISGQIEGADVPEPAKRGTHEVACAVSLVDGH
jgi:hypothetical protein